MKTVQIAPNVQMPVFGFGTFRLNPSEVQIALKTAIDCGQRFFDTAAAYGNEAEIGTTLKEILPIYNLKRSDIFITTKLKPVDYGKDTTRPAFMKSLEQLQCDYIDLYLMHYPAPNPPVVEAKKSTNQDLRRETWLEMEKIKEEGLVRAIGVSNFEIRHLQEMKNYAKITPAVNQCEFHPHMQRRSLVDCCTQAGIHFQAFTSLGRNDPDLMEEPILVEIAKAHNVPVSQVLLAWPLQLGMSIFPKSANPDRIRSNFEARNLVLTDDEMKRISTLEKNKSHTTRTPWEVD